MTIRFHRKTSKQLFVQTDSNSKYQLQDWLRCINRLNDYGHALKSSLLSISDCPYINQVMEIYSDFQESLQHYCGCHLVLLYSAQSFHWPQYLCIAPPIMVLVAIQYFSLQQFVFSKLAYYILTSALKRVHAIYLIIQKPVVIESCFKLLGRLQGTNEYLYHQNCLHWNKFYMFQRLLFHDQDTIHVGRCVEMLDFRMAALMFLTCYEIKARNLCGFLAYYYLQDERDRIVAVTQWPITMNS